MKRFTALFILLSMFLCASFCLSCGEENNDDGQSEPQVPCAVELIFELNPRQTGYKILGVKKCECTKIEIPQIYQDLPVVEIATCAFMDNSTIKEVTIPKTVTRINQSAFENCVALEEVEFEDESQLTRINKEAFRNCKKLKDIELPSKVSSIGYGAFMDCQSLTEIEIPQTIKNIDQFTFAGNINLEEVTLPVNVKTIGYYAFSGCDKLLTINYLGTKNQWKGVTKQDCWMKGVPSINVFCTDGLLIAN